MRTVGRAGCLAAAGRGWRRLPGRTCAPRPAGHPAWARRSPCTPTSRTCRTAKPTTKTLGNPPRDRRARTGGVARGVARYPHRPRGRGCTAFPGTWPAGASCARCRESAASSARAAVGAAPPPRPTAPAASGWCDSFAASPGWRAAAPSRGPAARAPDAPCTWSTARSWAGAWPRTRRSCGGDTPCTAHRPAASAGTSASTRCSTRCRSSRTAPACGAAGCRHRSRWGTPSSSMSSSVS